MLLSQYEGTFVMESEENTDTPGASRDAVAYARAGRELGGRARPVGRAAATPARLIPSAFTVRSTFALSGKPPCPFTQ